MSLRSSNASKARPINIRFSTNILRARVACFAYCADENCPWTRDHDPHLKVSTKILDLHQGSARAVSYAWGEFDRAKRSLGHFDDGRTLELELGEEWHLDDLKGTLSALCKSSEGDTAASSWLWMDQVCIDQTDPEDVLSTLNSIPEIFRIFATVVLLPGSPCECLSIYADKESATIPNIRDEWYRNPCLSLLCASGWSTRLWTRQELMYAGRVRVAWTQPEASTCIRLDDVDDTTFAKKRNRENAREVPDAIRLWTARCRAEQQRQELRSSQHANEDSLIHLKQKLLHAARRTLNNLTQSLQEWAEVHNRAFSERMRGHPQRHLIHMYTTNFLCGVELASDYWHALPDPTLITYYSPSDEEQMEDFLRQLSTIHLHERYATKQRDYIIAIWVDCPGYEVPRGYQDMEPMELLHNALAQFGQRNMHLWSSVPAALFGDTTRQFAWLPEHCVSAADIVSVQSVYSALLPSVEFGSWQLRVNRRSPDPRVLRMLHLPQRRVSNRLEALPPLQAITLLQQAASTWPPHYHNRPMRLLQGRMLVNDHADQADFLWNALQGYTLVQYSQARNKVVVEGLLQDKHDLDKAAFENVCVALGIEPELARQRGLKLMVCHEPPMLGLTRYELDARPEPTRGTSLLLSYISARPDEQELVMAYECSRAVGILGVWVPADVDWDRWVKEDGARRLVAP